MLVGVMVGIGIMLVCPLIPIAHFVLVPASPFIAGYWGIQFAPNTERHYAIHGLIYGALLGLVMAFVLAAVAFIVVALFDDPRVKVLAWIGVVVFTLYTGSMGTLGAMYSSLRAQQRAGQESGQEAPDA